MPLEREARSWLARYASSLSAADIEDLIQQAYAQILSADLAKIDQPRAYFYRTLRNLIAEQARHSQIVPMERLGEIEALFIPSGEPGPDRRYAARQELAHFLARVEALPLQCRRAFELCRILGHSVEEAAREMKISKRTVDNHLANAQRHLADAQMKPDAGVVTDHRWRSRGRNRP